MLLVAFTQVININAKCHVHFFLLLLLFFIYSFVCLTVCPSVRLSAVACNKQQSLTTHPLWKWKKTKNNILQYESILHVVYFVFLKTKLMHVNTNVNKYFNSFLFFSSLRLFLVFPANSPFLCLFVNCLMSFCIQKFLGYGVPY